MISRRQFIASISAAATAPTIGACATAHPSISLRSDPGKIIDLPDGFHYNVVSRAGEPMSDGLRVPGYHDGMAAFEGADGRIVLICNHELDPDAVDNGAFDGKFSVLDAERRALLYDQGDGLNPGLGGTTTTIYNAASGKTERQFLSLAGTEANCAGGPTPWNSWLSCEECFEPAGQTVQSGTTITRAKKHGYVFEVPASASSMIDAKPIKAMGRFEHEAAAVDPRSGVVYLTEDRHHSLFYRYLPDVPGQLSAGGKLQALGLVDSASAMTHNWYGRTGLSIGENLAVRWIDLDDVDSDENDLRLRGAQLGAATFARGEGLCATQDGVAFTCTIGGVARLGQVFHYSPSPYEGTDQEQSSPGQLSLIAEADDSSILRNADNITMAPWEDLIVCEDTTDHCGLVGIRADGSQYAIADNAHSDSELAGACFSPDGSVLFVNIQYPGMTLAISGPWSGSWRHA